MEVGLEVRVEVGAEVSLEVGVEVRMEVRVEVGLEVRVGVGAEVRLRGSCLAVLWSGLRTAWVYSHLHPESISSLREEEPRDGLR